MAPPPVAVRLPPATPAPAIVEDFTPGLVTTRPLTPRKVTGDDESLGPAVGTAASHSRGIPPLRPAVGIMSLATALLGLIAIWWKSVGARMWRARRRKAQPRLMIDIPLAEDSAIGELRPPGLAFDRESA
ncbi:MAG: hypothetical protein JWQ20_4586 [Conexibacter sp.]|nr:hypothetical protein [Conexibacter sp.]